MMRMMLLLAEGALVALSANAEDLTAAARERMLDEVYWDMVIHNDFTDYRIVSQSTAGIHEVSAEAVCPDHTLMVGAAVACTTAAGETPSVHSKPGEVQGWTGACAFPDVGTATVFAVCVN